jgi:rhamnosyltransferase
MTQIVAGIVIFNPDQEALARLVERIAPDVGAVLIYANSPVDAAHEAALQDKAKCAIAVLGRGDNVGLGAAYNALVVEAEARQADFLLIFDQDSLPPEGMAQQLAEIHRSLTASGERPAAIGPRFIEGRGLPMWPKLRDGAAASGGGATKVECVISSGSLIDVAAVRQVGPFRADFFIDAIDVEWCMRATSRGFSIWVARNVAMEHEIGMGVIEGPFGLRLPRHPPLRTYTLIRNQASMLRMSHVSLRYKLKVALFLPLRMTIYLAHARFARPLREAVWRGFADGLLNRLGPPTKRLS